MEQTSIFKREERVCMFSGHRFLDGQFSADALLNAVDGMIERGVKTFVNGMAIGFDLLAAEFVLMRKEIDPEIKLILCIPCEGQNKYFSKEDSMRYRNVRICADEERVLAPRYYRGCMQMRDKYMVEMSDVLITYCKKKEGGTAYTVRYFQNTRPDGRIIFL